MGCSFPLRLQWDAYVPRGSVCSFVLKVCARAAQSIFSYFQPPLFKSLCKHFSLIPLALPSSDTRCVGSIHFFMEDMVSLNETSLRRLDRCSVTIGGGRACDYDVCLVFNVFPILLNTLFLPVPPNRTASRDFLHVHAATSFNFFFLRAPVTSPCVAVDQQVASRGTRDSLAPLPGIFLFGVDSLVSLSLSCGPRSLFWDCPSFRPFDFPLFSFARLVLR